MQNIHCTEFNRLLESAVEQRRPAEAMLREHAASCEYCRPVWEQYAVLEDALAPWLSGTPEVDLGDSVLAKFAYENEHSGRSVELARQPVAHDTAVLDTAEARVSRNHSRSRWTIAATLIAGTAAVVMTAVLMPSPPAIAPASATAESKTVESKTVAAATSPSRNNLNNTGASHRTVEQAELTSAVRDAGAAYIGLANGAAEAFAQGAVLLPAATVNSGAVASDEGIQPTWVDRVRDEVDPLGERLEGALEFLIDAFPTEPSPTT